MILADTESQRRIALDKICPCRRATFKGHLRVMGERPVTIRYLSIRRLHEILPTKDMTPLRSPRSPSSSDTTPDA